MFTPMTHPTKPDPSRAPAERDELPVVARLVVEVRSDGTRTIARGALEDREHGEGVGIEVTGDSPLQLALALARSLSDLPGLARSVWAHRARAMRRRLPWSQRDDGEH